MNNVCSNDRILRYNIHHFEVEELYQSYAVALAGYCIRFSSEIGTTREMMLRGRYCTGMSTRESKVYHISAVKSKPVISFDFNFVRLFFFRAYEYWLKYLLEWHAGTLRFITCNSIQ